MNTVATNMNGSSQASRLLDLPQELRDKVYKKYYEDAPYAMFRQGHPHKVSLQVERACRKMCLDSRQVREKVWPKTLEITGYREFARLWENNPWLQDRIQEIRLECIGSEHFREGLLEKYDSMRRLDLNALFPRLQRLHVVQLNAVPPFFLYRNSHAPLSGFRRNRLKDAIHIHDHYDYHHHSTARSLQLRPIADRMNTSNGVESFVRVHVATRFLSHDPRSGPFCKASTWDIRPNGEKIRHKYITCMDGREELPRFLRNKGYSFPEQWRQQLMTGNRNVNGDRYGWVDVIA